VDLQQVMSQGAPAAGSMGSGMEGVRPGRYNGKSSFSAWKLKVLAYLQTIGVRDVVINDPGIFRINADAYTTIEGVSAAQNRASKLKKSEKAYSLLLNLLEDELIDLVATVDPGDAFMVWKMSKYIQCV
jgi:hypothetical protein